MTTSLSPVTETEMNNFFSNISEGFTEFKSRMATTFVAMSEQAETISRLIQTVERLQNSVDAMTATVRQLTEDRDRAEAECRRAQQSERAALDIAAEVESQLSATKAHVAELTVDLDHATKVNFNLEIANAELREQNDRQKLTLSDAVNENERLQAEMSRMLAACDDKIKSLMNQNDLLENNLAAQGKLNRDQGNEVKRLTNMLSVAKTVLEGVPIQHKDIESHWDRANTNERSSSAL